MSSGCEVVVVSIWPLVVSAGMGMGVLGVGAGAVEGLVLGLVLVVFGLGGWVGEDQVKITVDILSGEMSSAGAGGVLVFIFSEFMFFLSLVVASVYLVGEWDSGVWVDMQEVPLVISLLLLSSGVSITLFHQAIYSSDWLWGSLWGGVTILLGASFVVVQYGEWVGNWFHLSDGVGGSLFYVVTGFHGLHVVLGVTLNSVLVAYILRQGWAEVSSWKSEGVVWYWHFVDVVWLFVYLTIYWYCM